MRDVTTMGISKRTYVKPGVCPFARTREVNRSRRELRDWASCLMQNGTLGFSAA